MPDALLLAFGDAVRSFRTSLGISQEELGRRAGIDRTYIGRVERGERNVSLRNIVRIADALDVMASELIAQMENARR